MKRYIFLLIFAIYSIFSLSLNAQNDKVKTGFEQITSQQGGYYNFSDKDKVNIEVSVWGYVKFPGKYLIPQNSTFVDLVSYSGGPSVEANLEDIRLFRPKNDTLNLTQDELIKLNYNDLFWDKDIKKYSKRNIKLIPGDVIIFPGGPRYYFRDNLTLILSVATTLVSIAVLMVTIFRK